MGRFAIAAYRPKPGQEGELLQLTREHLDVLRQEGLATDRPSYAMQAGDGTVLEVFEWKSRDAIAAAHDNRNVKKLWERYAAACDYVPLTTLAEAHNLFAEFEALEL